LYETNRVKIGSAV